MSEFRKLKHAFHVLPATERSQALQGLRMFGAMTTKALAENMGVDRAMLEVLLAEHLVERKEHDGREYWQLDERLDDAAYAKALYDETANQGTWP